MASKLILDVELQIEHGRNVHHHIEHVWKSVLDVLRSRATIYFGDHIFNCTQVTSTSNSWEAASEPDSSSETDVIINTIGPMVKAQTNPR